MKKKSQEKKGNIREGKIKRHLVSINAAIGSENLYYHLAKGRE